MDSYKLDLDVILFAAGLGTRLRPYTLETPKPAILLNEVPLGYYLLPYLEQISYRNLVVNTFHLPDKVHELYENLNLNIQFSDEDSFIKGSAGGIKAAEKFFQNSDVILAANSDEVLFCEDINFLTHALEAHVTNKNLATLIVMKHSEAGKKFGGIWCDQNKVLHIGKDPDRTDLAPYHFVGLQFLSPKILELIEPNQELNIFYDVLVHQLKGHKVQIYEISADWYETGNINDYMQAKAVINLKLKTNKFYQQFYQQLLQLPKLQGCDLA